MALEDKISNIVGEVRTDTFDMSFGEITNLHKNNELIISPEYQRLFRWSIQQKSQLIESILLGLPIPQIFVIENQDGVLELIDGLQRVSSVMQFIDPESIELDPLNLMGCTLIPELDGNFFVDLPLSLRLSIKRTSIRTIVIKKQSKEFLKYEMFKRLNTGGSNLAPQEIRNCSSRMLGEKGVKFYSLLVELSQDENFSECVQYLPDAEKEKKGEEELVLRFFAAKNYRDGFHGSIQDWLDNYMEGILLSTIDFDHEKEKGIFKNVFKQINEKLGDTAFLRFRGDSPIGALPPAYFEAISIGFVQKGYSVSDKDPQKIRNLIKNLVQSQEFRRVTGPGANSREKLNQRIQLVADILENA